MRFWRKLKIFFLALACLILLGVLSIIALRLWVHRAYRQRIVTEIEHVPLERAANKEGQDDPRVAIVFGAGLWSGGTPSPVLFDRIQTAVDLYHAGRVDKLLLTGDNRFQNYNEPAVMRRTALEMGVPSEALVLDYAGRRTYDSCYRAKEIYKVNRAVLVTQAFHLDRAMYLCESLGIKSLGVAADRQTYGVGAPQLWTMREVLATAAAWADLHILHPVPILGERTPITEMPERRTTPAPTPEDKP